MPLLVNSFIQFIAPTLQLMLAVFLFKETFTMERWVTVGCVWVAVAMFMIDAAIQWRQRLRLFNKEVEVSPQREGRAKTETEMKPAIESMGS